MLSPNITLVPEILHGCHFLARFPEQVFHNGALQMVAEEVDLRVLVTTNSTVGGICASLQIEIGRSARDNPRRQNVGMPPNQ